MHLTHTNIRYGGYLGGSYVSLYNSGGTLDLDDVEIATSTVIGLYQYSGTADIDTSDFFGASTSIWVAGGTTTIFSTQIHDNDSVGFRQSGGTAEVTYSEIYGNNWGFFIEAGESDIFESDVYDQVYGLYFTGGISDISHSYIYNHSSRGISNNGADLRIDRTDVATNTTYGVYQSSGASVITSSVFRGHDNGLYILGGSVDIVSSGLFGNASHGLYNGSGSSIDAEYNWWGDISGPYNSSSNPTGSGDSVSNDVEFSPWLTSWRHYILSYSAVRGLSLEWDGSPGDYWDAWNGATTTWDLGLVPIVSATTSPADLTVSTTPFIAQGVVGYYQHFTSPPDDLVFSDDEMSGSTTSAQLMAATHELGHALGLAHSYPENIMIDYQTEQTWLGSQDTDDYSYLW